MKPSAIKKAISACIAARKVPFLWGPPGVGKSQTVAQVAGDLGRELRDVRAILLDPVDLRGLPHVNGDGRAHWAVPDFLPRDGAGLLFADELNAAPQAVQAAFYQLILDRKLGDYVLPEGWDLVAAGNRETDRAVTHRMPSALANRFVHLPVEVDLDDWCRWALAAGVRTEIIAFLRFRPALLHAFDPQQKAFPTPRSWQFVSDLLAVGPHNGIELDLLTGTVGEAAACELIGFLRVFRRMPSPDAVLMNPSGSPVPTDPATLYALAGALARKASDTNIDRVVTFADRLPAEFSVLLVRDAIAREPGLQQSRAFIGWSAAHADVLI
ncbi:MAG: MoxR family ATPase [Azospirillum sp.]|nr:MoxR family ATPase [Azospirillum sp.]